MAEGAVPEKADNFYRRVYAIAARIPPGKVATYGQIAAVLGNPRASRAVGWAMLHCPAGLDVPCHRVVNKTGAMAPEYVFGGAARQRALLESEGVIFLEDGRIDMKKCLWRWEASF